MIKRNITQFAAWVTFPLLVCLLVWVPLPLSGSEDNPVGKGNLKGFIYKRDGKTPLWGAQVLLKEVKTGKIFESNVTDAVGDYKFMDIPEGNYKLKILVKDKDYEVKTADFMVKIFDGKTSTLSFSLKKYRKFLILGLPLCKVFAIIAGVATVGVLVL
ncbi:MAG: hypothetical protein PVH61_04690 [Candidatus Aminicenantes bacterium]|jgi:hypothetical protein